MVDVTECPTDHALPALRSHSAVFETSEQQFGSEVRFWAGGWK
jgi:hypothetical protein